MTTIMKGLNHRFSKDETFDWLFWQRCMWCGENKWDALHHIISPSSRDYHKVDCNKSILNSCPIHNSKCHLNNSQLHQRENEIELLQKTFQALSSLGYKLKEIDEQFMVTYWESHYKYVCITLESIQGYPAG
jgi:hypothetical protein